MLRKTLLFLSDSTAAKAFVTKTPLRGMSRRFVAGEEIDDLVAAIREANEAGLDVTANYLGESEKSEENARDAGDRYLQIMNRVTEEGLNSGVSLKFTQLGQDIGESFLEDNLGRLLEKGRDDGIFIRFDMESSKYTQRTLDAFEKLWSGGWRNIGVVLQSYLFRTEEDVVRMNRLGVPVRLCKGAYAEPPEVAHQSRAEVDGNFVKCMRLLLAEGNHAAIATHDDRMIAATVDFARREGIGPERFEFQMLSGVRRDLQRQLLADGFSVRAYIPFGRSWYPYLMRRLAERPANVLFLAGSVIQESPFGFLWPARKGNAGRE